MIQLAKNGLLVCVIGLGAIVFLAGSFSTERVTFLPGTAGMGDSSVAGVIAEVDRALHQRWDRAGIEPAGPADPFTVVRRISLGLAGTLPSVEELRALEQVPEAERVTRWLERMLRDRRTHDHLAERFSRALVGTEAGPFIVYRRHRFVDWLSDQIAAGRPYDGVVREIIGQTGLWTDRPGVNFYTVTAKQDEENRLDPIRLAAKTSRAFLAMRIDCLECHDDFLGTVQLGDPADPKGGEQIDFHHLAAFFSQVSNSLAGVQDRINAPPYTYQLLEDDAPREIEPAVPYFDELLPSEGPLRHRLATWVTHPENLPFARATVNRLWAIVFGKPLVEPIDDIPWGAKVPEELDILARDFIAGGYDLARTIRILVGTQAFLIESRLPNAEPSSAHETNWAVFPLIRLRPEQMAGSLLQATSLTTLDASAHVLNRVVNFGQQNNFIDRFGDFGRDEFMARGETVTQRLLLLNGELIRGRTDGGLLAPNQVGAVSPDLETAVEVAYLSCFTRYPTEQEIKRFVDGVSVTTGGERQAAIQDLYWAMLNSAEFSWNH